MASVRDDVVVAWADRYRRNLDAMPAPTSPITVETWREGLGAIDRIADWVAFFRTQLVEASWRAVFTEWIGRLLPAAPSAGAHGLIRTAHALRALQNGETALRIEEFGVALAYWAAYYRKLPGVSRTFWAPSITAKPSARFHSSCAASRGEGHRERSTSA